MTLPKTIEQRLQEFLEECSPALPASSYSEEYRKGARVQQALWLEYIPPAFREILQEALEEQHKQFLESAKSNAEWTTKYIERKLKAQREALGVEEKKECLNCALSRQVGSTKCSICNPEGENWREKFKKKRIAELCLSERSAWLVEEFIRETVASQALRHEKEIERITKKLGWKQPIGSTCDNTPL